MAFWFWSWSSVTVVSLSRRPQFDMHLAAYRLGGLLDLIDAVIEIEQTIDLRGVSLRQVGLSVPVSIIAR